MSKPKLEQRVCKNCGKTFDVFITPDIEPEYLEYCTIRCQKMPDNVEITYPVREQKVKNQRIPILNLNEGGEKYKKMLEGVDKALKKAKRYPKKYGTKLAQSFLVTKLVPPRVSWVNTHNYIAELRSKSPLFWQGWLRAYLCRELPEFEDYFKNKESLHEQKK